MKNSVVMVTPVIDQRTTNKYFLVPFLKHILSEFIYITGNYYMAYTT